MTNGTSSQAAAQEENLSICKFCSKKVINKVVCSRCGEIFHPACLKQASELKRTDCKHEPNKTSSEEKTANGEDKYFSIENKLLKEIIQDKNTIINDKEQLISLLQQKITYLEEIISNNSYKNAIEKRSDFNKNANKIFPNEAKSLSLNKNDQTNQQLTAQAFSGTGNPSTTNIISPKKIKAAVNYAVTYNKLSDVQNLTELPANEGEWMQQKRRRRHFVVGSNSENSSIQTVPKLVSLHVTRLDPSVTPDQMKTLLISRFPEVECESHVSKRPELYSSIKVSIDRNHLKEAWQRDVWPAGTLVSFFRKKRMLQQNMKTADPL